MYFPVADIIVSPWLLLFLGLIVGTLGGFFGIGGAFLMTPAMNALGFPMIYAIGTDLALMFGSSTVATLRHAKFGNVDVRLGLSMIAGTAVGVWLGKQMVFALHTAGHVDTVVRLIFICLLAGLANFMLRDYFRFVRAHGRAAPQAAETQGTALSRFLRSLKLPPFVDFPVSGIPRISIWAPIGIGLLTGFLAGLLGIGGGFIRMPALIYGLGVPTSIAVGTDLFEIIFSSAIGALLYSMEGKVELLAAAIMLVGATIGAQIGSYATRYVFGMRIRFYLGLTILAAAISVLMKQLGEGLHIPILEQMAAVLIMGSSTLMTLVVIVKLIIGKINERQH